MGPAEGEVTAVCLSDSPYVSSVTFHSSASESLGTPGLDCKEAVKDDKIKFYPAASIMARCAFVNSFYTCV